jgi:hypothetical protein
MSPGGFIGTAMSVSADATTATMKMVLLFWDQMQTRTGTTYRTLTTKPIRREMSRTKIMAMRIVQIARMYGSLCSGRILSILGKFAKVETLKDGYEVW